MQSFTYSYAMQAHGSKLLLLSSLLSPATALLCALSGDALAALPTVSRPALCFSDLRPPISHTHASSLRYICSCQSFYSLSSTRARASPPKATSPTLTQPLHDRSFQLLHASHLNRAVPRGPSKSSDRLASFSDLGRRLASYLFASATADMLY
jgi:hypothetical protein